MIAPGKTHSTAAPSTLNYWLREQAEGEAAAAVWREFKTFYGLATRRIATDGIDIFIDYVGDDLARAHEGQLPIREIIDEHLRYITWDDMDGSPSRPTLLQYPDVAPVVIDQDSVGAHR